jgi:hypothetical protein
LVNDVDAFIEGDARYVSNRPADEYSSRFIPASTVAKLRLGLEAKQWRALIYIDNVLNQDELQGSLFSGDFHYPGRIAELLFPANKRAVGARVCYHG